VIPPLYVERITPHTEGLAAVVWHLLVSHPALKLGSTKWESMTARSAA
jgi:D-sedoheptulose 7-phosphate isomerase